MRERQNAGLRDLPDAASVSQPPTPYTLGFVLGPRINAGGRIGDAALGARLLSIDDEAEATRIAATLDKLNRERKSIETGMLEAAVAEADRLVEADADLPIVLVGSEEWHKGVVGLVASRLVERFRRPSCVIAWEKTGQGTGSLRSIAGVDIGSAVRALAAEGLLVKGGGHAMAAGLTVARDKLDLVRSRFDKMLREKAGTARAATVLEFDGAMTPAGVSEDFLDLVEKAGPYGQGNPSPRFAFPAHRVRFAKVMGEAHIRCLLEAADGSRLDAIAFRAVGQPVGDAIQNANGMPMHIAGHLRRDSWGGKTRIELQIEDVAEMGRG